jgi:hypothetical protein
MVSDTSPLSRIFLENISEFKGKLIIWICNRFNYNMTHDREYYDLFKKAISHDNVSVIPYTEFERLWAQRHGIHIHHDVIRPIGKSIDIPLSENENSLIGFGGDYQLPDGGDILISRYHNDNIYQNSLELFSRNNIKADVAKYHGYFELQKLAQIYKAYFIIPEQYSKLVCFELMNLSLPVILPSEKLLLQLSTFPNFWFGSGLNPSTVHLCEWYNEYYDKFAIYINDYEDIRWAYETIDLNRQEICGIMQECSKQHEEKTLNQWRQIYNV